MQICSTCFQVTALIAGVPLASLCVPPGQRIADLDRSYRAPVVALSQVWRTNGRPRTIHSGTTPTPFSAALGHGCMNSLAHIPHSLRFTVFRRSVSPAPLDTFFLSQHRIASSTTSPLPSASAPLPRNLDHPDNFYKPHSLHSICISPASAAPAASF